MRDPNLNIMDLDKIGRERVAKEDKLKEV